ncbi:MAG TPA: hypothetical protein VGM54_21090 [Chthoniobacter sp.]|jgi:hypothetical protein
MNWLNLEIRTLRSPEYIGSEPVERATWLNLLAYCCEQENGGRLLGAASWKDRQWQQVCGVTAREVQRAPRLIRIEGDDVVVFAYPAAKEDEVRLKREQAREAGIRSGAARARHSNDRSNGRSASGSTAPEIRATPRSTEGERKEKGKEDLSPPPVARGGLPMPSKIEEVRAFAGRFQPTGGAAQMPDPGFVEWWWEEQEKRGWTDAPSGLPLRNWQSAFNAAWRGHCHRKTERAARTYGPHKPAVKHELTTAPNNGF